MRGQEFEQRQFVNNVDFQYLALLRDILQNGTESTDRTGTGTKKVFGRMLDIDLSGGFPLLTTKKVWFHGVKEELLWFVRGERNIRSLVLKNVGIWNEWPYQKYLEAQGLTQHVEKYGEDWQIGLQLFVDRIKADEKFAEKWGDLGPVYGYQWRHWKKRDGGEIDQLANAVDLIKNNPDSRRIAVTAWNPEDVAKAALPPCHIEYQFQTEGDILNCMMLMRSVDTFLGLPFNIASYALLTHLVAQVTDKVPGRLVIATADTHIYLNHLNQVELQLTRDPRPLPKLVLSPDIKNIDDVASEAISIQDYDPYPKIEAPISV